MAALAAGIVLFMLGFLVMGFGLIAIGIPPTAEEFMRVIFFLILKRSLCGILVELVDISFNPFKQAATTLACGDLVVFSVFYITIKPCRKTDEYSAWAS
ncbi:MAG: hypothetical protein ACLR6J_07735 [Parabacteroides merdae]